MRNSRYSEGRIVGVLREAAEGVALGDLIGQHGSSPGFFNEWKAKSSGMSVADLKRLNELEAENRRLAYQAD